MPLRFLFGRRSQASISRAGRGYGASGEDDAFTGIENLRGSPDNDVLIGNGGRNDLIGCGGSDRLNGLAGNDTLRGDGIGCRTIGADMMIGAPKVDTVNLVECR